jgi:outer membrane receptor for ferric coprogen and ferric-rhodotorulic acid
MSNVLLKNVLLKRASILSAVLAATAQVPVGNAAEPASEPADGKALITEILVLGRRSDQIAGAKDLTPVFETPSSLTVIDSERFLLQRLVSVEDLFREMPGVTTTKTVSAYPKFFARGFEISSFLVDGVPGSSGVNAPYSVPDLFLFERVELLRGPSALFSGSGSPGGSLNLARKRPGKDFKLTSAVEGGSWDFMRAEFDVNSPLNDDGTVRARAGAAWQDAGEFIDHYQKDRKLFFGSVAFDVTDSTTLTAGAHYDQYKSTVQVGLPGIAGVGLIDLPRDSYAGGNENYFETKSSQVYGEIAQRMSENWNARLNVQYTKLDREEEYLWGRGPITATDGTIALFGYHGAHDANLFSADLNAVGTFDLFGRTHGVLFGADYQRSEWEYRSNSASDTGLTFDYYNPVVQTQPDLPLTPGGEEYFTGKEVQTQYGIYGQTRLSLADKLTGVLGARVAWVKYDYQEFDAIPTGVYSVDAKVSPYVGLVYDLTSEWNVYTSFADVFQPQADRKSNFAPVGPVIGKQYEIGAKGNLIGGRLLLSGALYRIRQSNRAVADPNDPNFSVGSGLVQSEGFELEANGTLSHSWTLEGGYTYNKNKTLRDTDPALVGTQFIPVIPENSVKLFTNYAIEEGALAGFSVGGGLTWNSESIGLGVEQESYVVASLRGGYQVSDRALITLNINNLFDETYYENIRDARFGNYYGAPRSAFVRLTVTY